MKKFAIASAALSSTALVFAVAIATPAAAQEFQGPYVGAQVGWNVNGGAKVGHSAA